MTDTGRVLLDSGSGTRWSRISHRSCYLHSGSGDTMTSDLSPWFWGHNGLGSLTGRVIYTAVLGTRWPRISHKSCYLLSGSGDTMTSDLSQVVLFTHRFWGHDDLGPLTGRVIYTAVLGTR
ncbi:hypothetical protein J6590_062239 [Homalodisca vitripennis]|nr:hypothetical protein J6590_062239 [Homalodisca vitripennis]